MSSGLGDILERAAAQLIAVVEADLLATTTDVVARPALMSVQ